MKKSALLLSALLLSASALAAIAKEVKVGVIMPMSGPIGGFGQSAYKGLELMNELDHKLKNGDTVKLVLIDNKSDKIESANAMEKLVASDKVTAVVGALTSTNTLAITKQADSTKTAVVAPVATLPRVTKNRDYVSRVCFIDDFQGIVGANHLYKNLKAKNVALIIDSKQDYSIGLSKAFEKQFKSLGGKIAKKVVITGGDKDFKAQVSAIKAAKVDAIYMPIYSNEAALFVVQAHQLGLKVPMVGGDGVVADDVFFKVAKGAANGVMVSNYYDPTAKQTARGEEFAKAYDKKYGEEVHMFAAMAADAYNVIIAAMNQCKDPADKTCVNTKIRATKDFEGVSGVINIDDQGNAVRSAVIQEVKGGKLTYLSTVNP